MTIELLHVVMPARNEEQLVGPALIALDGAIETLHRVAPRMRSRATIVLDRSTDRTADVALAHGIDTLFVDYGRVGATRHAGVVRATEQASLSTPGIDAERVWIASTDADSEVPGDWLVEQLRLAADHDLVVGQVRPDGIDLDPRTLLEWERRHSTALSEAHRGVYGANLSFRLSTYWSVGGFAPISEHEDVGLVDAIRRAGHRWTYGDGAPVVTSARLRGRTSGGFAGYLRTLQSQLDSNGPPVTAPG